MGKSTYKKPHFAIPLELGGAVNKDNQGLFTPRVFQGIKILTGTQRTALDLMLTMFNLEKSILKEEFRNTLQSLLYDPNVKMIFKSSIIKADDWKLIDRDPLIGMNGSYQHLKEGKKDDHHKSATCRGGHRTNTENLAKDIPYNFHHNGIHIVYRTQVLPEKVISTLGFYPNAWEPEWEAEVTSLILDTRKEDMFDPKAFTKKGLEELKLFPTKRDLAKIVK